MPGTLVDTNVWIAAVFTTHPFHALAQAALQQATPAAPAVFCRATEQSFLRLASTPVLLKVSDNLISIPRNYCLPNQDTY